MKWYHGLSRRGQLGVTLAIGIPAAIIAAILIFILLGNISFRDFRSPTAPSPCPDYDPSDRLELQDDLTEQDVAQYVAALLPTEYQELLLGVKLTSQDDTSFVVEIYWNASYRIGGILLGSSVTPPQDVVSAFTQRIYDNTDYTITSLAFASGSSGSN